MKKTKTLYWIFTLVFAGLMIFTAIPGIKPQQDNIKIIHDGLGYPVYFIRFISIAKILGSIVILIPGWDRIKEWAYAGLFFDLAAVIYSGIAASGKFDPMMLSLLLWIIPGILSYIYFYKLRVQAWLKP